jgi:hypothetical protein
VWGDLKIKDVLFPVSIIGTWIVISVSIHHMGQILLEILHVLDSMNTTLLYILDNVDGDR